MDRLDPEIEELIESALRSEEMLPVPPTLHDRVSARLEVLALMEKERARFRTSMAMMAVALVSIIGGGLLFVAFTNLRGMLVHGAPGAKGRTDYLIHHMMESLSSYGGAYSLVVSFMLALGALALVVIPLRERMRHHHH